MGDNGGRTIRVVARRAAGTLAELLLDAETIGLVGSQSAGPGTPSAYRRSRQQLSRLVFASDALAIAAAIAVAHVTRYVRLPGPAAPGAWEFERVRFSAFLFVVWMISLSVSRTRDVKMLDSGDGSTKRSPELVSTCSPGLRSRPLWCGRRRLGCSSRWPVSSGSPCSSSAGRRGALGFSGAATTGTSWPRRW